MFTYMNISGINNLYSNDIIDGMNLSKSGLIGLVETWSDQKNFSFKNYHALISPAERVNVKGRAKGGLLLLNNPDIVSYEGSLHVDSFCIIGRYRIKRSSVVIIVILVYYPPHLDQSEFMNCLELLDNYADFYSDYPIFIAGDFNARVGNLDNHSSSVYNSYLSDVKCSRDSCVNAKGKRLISMCNDNQLMILNGRTSSDCDGDYTFVETIGVSVIDYAIANSLAIELARDLKVCSITSSAHCALQLSIDAGNNVDLKNTSQSSKIVIREKSLADFQKRLQNKVTLFDFHISYDDFKSCLFQSAKECRMIHTPGKQFNQKPWYDEQCYELKKTLQNSLKVAKMNKWKEADRSTYIETKKKYHSFIKAKSKSHWLKYIDRLNMARNSGEFWSVVKTLNRKAIPSNPIEEETWIQFYERVMPIKTSCKLQFFDVLRPLDCDFTIEELNGALKHAKNHKAAGPDGIPNEVLKNLTPPSKQCLLAIFNEQWRKEIVPADWHESITAMIHKKGSGEDPVNYRPISLLNCPLKIFTQMLQTRLYEWAENANVLPQSQAGFRKSRSCHENIFVLKAAVDVRLRKKGRKLFAFFIDFSRAFPSIPHSKLWEKLFSIGVSAKYIRWLKILYENSKMRIRLQGNSLSSEIAITEGVLQGEVLSPLLFNLYISEVQTVLENSGGIGANIDTSSQIHMLAYADDMVVLSESAYGMKLKIKALEEYFASLSLSVNIDKTKILVFQKGGRISRKLNFEYNGTRLEIVSKYTYLGVVFSSSGKFVNAAVEFKKSGCQAIGAIWKVLTKGKINEWDSFIKLYNACIKPTALYCADIWAPKYLNSLERVQLHFFKKLLTMSKMTPDAVVRMETGISHMELSVAKQALETWRRYSLIPEDRFANKFLKRCIELHNIQPLENSWIGYLDKILQNHSTSISINSNVVEMGNLKWNLSVKLILDNLKEYLWSRDRSWLLERPSFSY